MIITQRTQKKRGTRIDRKVGLTVSRIHLKKSLQNQYKISTLTPFGKPRHLITSTNWPKMAYMESAFKHNLWLTQKTIRPKASRDIYFDTHYMHLALFVRRVGLDNR